MKYLTDIYRDLRRNNKCIAEIEAHCDPITSVDFHITGTKFITSSYDGVLRLWDTPSMKCLKEAYSRGAPPM